MEPEDLWVSIFAHVYGQQPSADTGPIQSHRIAVIYMMLALATLLDLEKPPYPNDAG